MGYLISGSWSCLGGKIGHVLLNLQHLEYLDLGGNDFQGLAAPNFLKTCNSLTSVTYHLLIFILFWKSIKFASFRVLCIFLYIFMILLKVNGSMICNGSPVCHLWSFIGGKKTWYVDCQQADETWYVEHRYNNKWHSQLDGLWMKERHRKNTNRFT